jgi:hypothetical protein
LPFCQFHILVDSDMKPHSHVRVVECVAGRSFLDEAAAALFAQILENNRIASKVEPAGTLTVSRISRLSAEGAHIVCLSYFDADTSSASARFAVKRLRRHLPGTKVLGGSWQTGTHECRGLGSEGTVMVQRNSSPAYTIDPGSFVSRALATLSMELCFRSGIWRLE